MKTLSLAIFALLALVACGAKTERASPTAPPSAVLDEHANKSGLTVLLFFTAECPVQKAHDTRVREIVESYGQRGVTFLAIASEVNANVALEREEAKRRLGTPLVEDKGAALANALGVEYSTHVVVLDQARRVVYSGALDADRTHLTDGAERYLRNALDAAIVKQPVAKPRTEALGCPLRKQ